MAVTSSVEPAAMRPLFRRCVAFAPLLILVLLVSDQNISARPRMPVDMPPLVLWAWDRDDDLSFIDIRDTAVAYLAATVILRGKSVFLTPRHHPLAAPKGTRLVALAHVEVDRHEPPVVSDAQARDFRDACRITRGPPGGISSDRLRGESVATRPFREGGCGVAPAPSECGPLGHRADILVPQRTVDAVAGGGRGGPDALPLGSRSPTHPGLFRRRGRFSLGQLPHQHRRRDG